MRLINVDVAAPQELSRERELIVLAIEEANQTFRDADLGVRLVRASGIQRLLVRHSGKHDWYSNPRAAVSQPVPRHREIHEFLAAHILKKLKG